MTEWPKRIACGLVQDGTHRDVESPNLVCIDIQPYGSTGRLRAGVPRSRSRDGGFALGLHLRHYRHTCRGTTALARTLHPGCGRRQNLIGCCPLGQKVLATSTEESIGRNDSPFFGREAQPRRISAL